MSAMLPRGVRVRKTVRETRDTMTLELEPVNGDGPVAFSPGQFNMLYAFGVGEVPISVSGDPGAGAPWVHTVRAVGAVSRALCGVRRGALVGLRGPFGSAWPVEEATGHDVVLMAGGIGLAPLRPALYYLEAHREKYGRVVLLYGARSPDELLYPKQLVAWRAQFDLQVEVTVDRATAGWRGQVGVVTQLLRTAVFEPEDALAFVCGPELMMRFSCQELETRGVPRERIYLSLERNMKCGFGQCGHCQLGPKFVCKDGPVFPLPAVQPLMHIREL
jgi:NAD(P)H-flavin reductase